MHHVDPYFGKMTKFTKLTLLLLIGVAVIKFEWAFYAYESLKRGSASIYRDVVTELNETSWEEFVEISNKAKKNKDLEVCQQIKSGASLQDQMFGREHLINLCEDGVARELDQHLLCKSSDCLITIARVRAAKGKDFLDVCERIKFLNPSVTIYKNCLDAKNYDGK
jgi:hypothetical protein